MLIMANRYYPKGAFSRLTGVDISKNMLEVGKLKLVDQNIDAEMIVGDASDLPFESDLFDVVTMSFGIRNVENLDVALTEISRVLSTSGKFAILEFSWPSNPLLGFVYGIYFKYFANNWKSHLKTSGCI